MLSNDIEIQKLKKSIPKRLDNLEYSRFHSMVVVALGVSWVLDGYEVALLAVLSGVLKENLSMDDMDIGVAGSFYLLGCVSGSLLFGYCSSKWGRKKLFTVTLIIYIISIVSTTFSIDKHMFVISRFFTGVAVGGEYSSIFAAIDELLPPYIRGRVDLIIDGTWHLGSTVAALISYFMLHFISHHSFALTKFLFLIGVLLALPIVYLRKFIPESPRWLVYSGKYNEALKIVEIIESQCKKIKEERKVSVFDEEREDKDAEREKERSDEDQILINYSFEESADPSYNSKFKSRNTVRDNLRSEITLKEIMNVFINKYPDRFFYGLVLMSSQAFFYNGIFYTYTLVLQKFYSVDKTVVGLYLIPLSLASFLGPLCLGKYFDSWSRRKMIFLTFSISGILLVSAAINFYYNLYPGLKDFLWFIVFFVASPAASSAHLTISEIFPLEMRSQAMAVFFSCGLGVGGVISPFLYGSFINENSKLSIFLSYLFTSLVMISAGIVGLFFGVNSENKSLEEISENIRDDFS